MPRDTLPQDTKRVLTGRQRLELLRDRLREPMPQGFAFDYSCILTDKYDIDSEGFKYRCDSAGCALGLCAVLSEFPDINKETVNNNVFMTEFFDMPTSWFHAIFYSNELFLPQRHQHILYPDCTRDALAVANAIDRYLRLEPMHAYKIKEQKHG